MKQEFSTRWIGSKNPRKQRKYLHNAPLHIRGKFLNAHLSKELRVKHGKRGIPLRKDDEILIMRGSFSKKKAKVLSVDTKRTRVVLDGITRNKRDGTKVPVFFHPSNLQIILLNAEDKERLKILTRGKEKNNAPNKSTN